jgi:nanoRNase/pAp phosphatase (c-di-AMP/oligoRNAs hydrolase)
MRVDLVYGGVIGRAENRVMTRLLRIPVRRVAQRDLGVERFDAIALIDTQPGTGNNLLPAGYVPDVVIDHHPLRRGTRGARFVDVQPEVGACATILTGYLRAANLATHRRLATALFYAIRSETQNLGRAGTEADARAFLTLFPRVDNRIIARIEQAPFSRDYLALLDTALRATRIYGKLAVTQLGDIPYPDVPAELADLIVRVDEVRWAFVVGRYRDRLHFSVRTEERRGGAGRLLRRVVGGIGRAGGHGMMAGGRLDLPFQRKTVPALERELIARVRAELGVARHRGQALLPTSALARPSRGEQE